MGVRLTLQSADGTLSTEDRPADSIPAATAQASAERGLAAGVSWTIEGDVATCSGSSDALAAFSSINPVTMYLNGIATRKLLNGSWGWFLPTGERVLNAENV